MGDCFCKMCDVAKAALESVHSVRCVERKGLAKSVDELLLVVGKYNDTSLDYRFLLF